MSTLRPSFAARLYRACLWVLPPSVRRVDGEEMVAAFEALWSDASGAPGRRARLLVRAFGRLPAVAVVEWADELELTWGGMMMGWGRDLRYAIRGLVKVPSFTFTVVFLIALGVGSVTTIFTLVDHVLLRPLPYPEPHRLVTVQQGSYSGVTYERFQEFNSVETWTAGYNEDANLTGEGDPIRIQQARVTGEFFPILGARPARGRLLTPSDHANDQVGVVMYDTWVRVFGADPELVGRTVRVDDQPVTVIGVLDESFEAPLNIMRSNVDLIRPLSPDDERLESINVRILETVGRLAPGATLEVFQAELDALAEQMAGVYPDDMVDRDGNPFPMPGVALQEATTERVRTGLNLLLGAVGLLLLVACLNVAHLFLARGLARSQEMAVRRALGSGWIGVGRQLLVESLVVGALGGALGLGLAWLGLEGYLGLNPELLPRADAVTLDFRVLLFAAAVATWTAVLFGMVPAMRTSRGDLVPQLKASARGATGTRKTTRLRNVLVVAEVALSLVLVAQAGYLMKSFLQAQANDLGIVADGVWTVPLTPTGMESPAQYNQEMEEVRASLAALPGVTSASVGLTQPFEITGGGRCCWSTSRVPIDGQPLEGVRLMLQPVSPEFFETLGVPIVAGEVWSRAIEEETPVPVVLSEQFVTDLFGSPADAVGRVIGDPDWMEMRIVGVAADVPYYGLDQPVPTSAYLPIAQVPFTIPMAHMAIKLDGPAPEGMQRSVRDAVWAAQPDMPVPTVQSMDDWIAASMAGRRFDSVLFGTFGVAGLLLAAAGLYGTLLYTVRQRSRELGIRLALGAGAHRIQREVVTSGILLTAVGSVVGVLGAWQLGRYLEAGLYEVEAGDPTALTGAVLLLVAAAMLSSWLPARRAATTDPLQTLQAD